MISPKRYTTVDQIDRRFIWLDLHEEIAETKWMEETDSNREKYKQMAQRIKHERKVLSKRRADLLTPELL